MDRVKRSVDLMLASILLVGLAPVMLVLAVVVKITSPGPALFKQHRVGREKRSFTMLKFRTMQHECDDSIHREYVTQLLTEPEPEGTADGDTVVYKLTDDPRITRVGRLLRRTSLDELPQLLNVVRGDMSLVGPRPVLDWEAELLGPEYEPRFAVKPGITGLWQVEGRNSLTMRQAVDLDLEYVRRRTTLLDLRILVLTVPTALGSAFTGKGAR
jgi:lipopolysaccharide/colanic/teichoic acid biosynthesis glycosyltransferase